jgi:uncharacterized protein with HEPN domain
MITIRAAKYLWDVQRAGGRIIRFTRGRAYDDYIGDDMVCSAVERQFEIIGEAFVQLRRQAPDVAALIPEMPQIIGFRNVLAHNYDGVDYKEVWNTIVNDLPRLLEVVGNLLQQAPKP